MFLENFLLFTMISLIILALTLFIGIEMWVTKERRTLIEEVKYRMEQERSERGKSIKANGSKTTRGDEQEATRERSNKKFKRLKQDVFANASKEKK